MAGEKIILVLPISNSDLLPSLVETWLHDKAALVAVVGDGAEEVEEAIDWIVVGNGKDQGRFLLTSCHENESVEDVMEFAKQILTEESGATKIVRL